MITSQIAEALSEILLIGFLIEFVKWAIILGIIGVILYFAIKKACNYQARRNAEEFDYDYLAEKTAAEIFRRMAIIERERAKANNSATSSAAEPNQGNRTGAAEQNASRQE